MMVSTEVLEQAQSALMRGEFAAALESLDALPTVSALVAEHQWRITRGVSLHGLGDLPGAEQEFRSVLQTSLDATLTCWKNLAGLLFMRGAFSEALGHIGQYRNWCPYDQEGVLLHSAILMEQKDFASAQKILEEYLEVFPDDLRVGVARIECLRAQRQYLPALFATAMLKRDSVNESLILAQNEVNCFAQLGLMAAAEHAFAVKAQPGAEGYDSFMDVVANFRLLNRQYSEAEGTLRAALPHLQNATTLPFNLGLTLLAQGKYREGWSYYANRKTVLRMNHLEGIPVWSGEALEGKRVLVHWEQGIGDSIIFMRYVPLLVERGISLVFNSQQVILDLLRGSGSGVAAFDVSELGDFDFQLHLLDLPAVYGTDDIAGIPQNIPYIFADPELQEKWRNRVGDADALHVGLVWAGNPDQGTDHFRSYSLTDLLPLAVVPGVRFCALQLGKAGKEVEFYGSEFPLLDFGPEIHSLADTAAIIANLDLVITSCTAVAHLAGAMGKPVWIVLPALGTFWLWEVGESDSPWYPSARLFRQTKAGNWDAVIREVRAALWQLVDETGKAAAQRNTAMRDWLQGLPLRDCDLTQWLSSLQNEDLHCAAALALELFKTREDFRPLVALQQRFASNSDVQRANAAGLSLRGGNSESERIWQHLEEAGQLSICDWLLRIDVAPANVASVLLERAAMIYPDCPSLMLRRATRLADAGYPQEAEQQLEKAAEITHRPVMLSYNRGILVAKKRVLAALPFYQQSLMFNPSHLPTWRAVASVALMQDLPKLGSDILEGVGGEALDTEGRLFLCELWAVQGREDEANRLLATIDRENLGEIEQMALVRALFALNRMAEYEATLQGLLACDTGKTEAQLIYALHRLKSGNFSEGWAAYRCAVKGRESSIPPWNGEPLAGKCLLVYQDQGAGDLIQFFPLLREVCALGATVSMALSPAMRELFAHQDVPIEFVPLDSVDLNSEAFDFQVAQMHLPSLLKCDLSAPRHQSPILTVPQGLLPQWDALIANCEKFKIGIVWAGNPQYLNDAVRSSRLAEWRELAAVEGVAWFNFQKDLASNQALGLPEFGLINPAPDCASWLQTASLLSQMDLVISVDTGVAHLAAALNVSTWILLPARGVDFRWQREGDNCPWYPSVRLFRKQQGERWHHVISRVRTALESKVALSDA